MDMEDPVIDSSEEQNISIDRLEDEIIDHPSGTPGANQFSDESFQHKLNERANQIQQGGEWSLSDPNNPYPTQNNNASYQFLYTKPNLVYEYSDHGDLRLELNQWFVAVDFKLLDLAGSEKLDYTAIDLNSSPRADSVDLWQVSEWLDHILYYALGEYGHSSSESEQIERIQNNCLALMSSNTFDIVLDLLKRALVSCSMIIEEKSNKPLTKVFCLNYFKLLTIAYFCLNVTLASKSSPSSVLSVLKKHDLLLTIVKLLEIWKISLNPHLRMRNCLLLQWKLMLVEFGDSEHLALADEFLSIKYEVKNKDRKDKSSQTLTCSRVDYFTFEEDFNDKFPMRNKESNSLVENEDEGADLKSLSSLTSEKLSLSQEKELYMATSSHSSSQSNFMEVPRTNKSHSVYGTLPGQTVHIATPVPSPPSTPSEFMAGGEKVRKSYHVNQGLPFIYPLGGTHNVPEAISEASLLIEEGVYESYSNKRLSRERALYLENEMGSDRHQEEAQTEFLFNSDQSDYVGKYEGVIASLERVDSYYQSVLKNMRGFVDVLMSVLKTSKIDVSLRDLEKELDPHTSFTKRFGCEAENTQGSIIAAVHHQMDILRAKEITLKAVSAILALTLRWFKMSHPIKAYYFSTLLFDAHFPGVFVEFLAESFNNPALQNFPSENKGYPIYDILSAQNRLRNPSVSSSSLDFFSVCRGTPIRSIEASTLINKKTLGRSPVEPGETSTSTVDITQFNRDFCFILINLLNVTNKILIRSNPQRIFVFNELKPTELLKLILLNFVNADLRTPILKIFKKLIPYQGRKWRALNMDVVSLIYLHMKLSLRDNWLSGKDLENEFRESLEQEMSLRSLVQFYNTRNYPIVMKSLGYTTNNSS